jgi:hypothetical protein
MKKETKVFDEEQKSGSTPSALTDTHSLLLPLAHDPRHFVDRVISRQSVKRAVQTNVLAIILSKGFKASFQRYAGRVRIFAHRATKRAPGTIVVVEAIGKAVLQRFLILPACEEVRVEAKASRVAIRKDKLAPVGEAVKTETEFGADVDDCYRVGRRTHAALRVAVELWVRVGHVREVVVGIEVDTVPARWEADVACDATAVESRWDAVAFADAGLDQNCSLAEVGNVVRATLRVACDYAQTLRRCDGVAHTSAIAWCFGVVGTRVVSVVGCHSLERQQIELAIVSDAIRGRGPVAGVVCCFVACRGVSRSGGVVGSHVA